MTTGLGEAGGDAGLRWEDLAILVHHQRTLGLSYDGLGEGLVVV